MNATAPTTGMSPQELAFEIQRGGRFIVYQYCVSLLVVTFRRNSPVKFLRAGESATVKGLPFTLLTLVLGWWGIPWGFIYTPQVLYKNLKGGTDITAAVLNRTQQQPATSSVARPIF
jgi:hypothetical protein